jgi:hypothetical protein
MNSGCCNNLGSSLNPKPKPARGLPKSTAPTRASAPQRKLLRAVRARLLGGKGRLSGIDDGDVNERVYGLGLAGFRRHSVFLAAETVEGPGIDGLVRELVDDPARSAAFSVWGPLLDGTPVLAREEVYWEAGQPQ